MKNTIRYHSGIVVSFDSEEELKDYIQATTWEFGLLGDTRVFNNKYEIRHHNNMVVSFDSEEELKDYIQACFENDCDLSQNS